VGIIEIFALVNSPYLGIDFKQVRDRWYISSVDPNGPAKMYPELKGKEINKIGEWKLEKSDLTKVIHQITSPEEYEHFWDAQKYLWEHVQPGKSISFTVMINNASKQYTITPSQVSISNVILSAISIFYLLTLVTLIIGLIVSLTKPENEVVNVFFFLTFFLCIYIITSGVLFNRFLTFEPVIFKSLYFLSIFGLILEPIFLHFALIFPFRHQVMRHQYIIWLIYALPVLAIIPIFVRNSFILYQIIALLQVVYLCAAAGVLLYNYVGIKSPIKKAQIKWVVFVFMLLTIVASFLLLEHVFFGRFNIFILLVMIPLIPLSMAFAIMRYKLMDIDTLFDNTLIYTVTIGLLALIDIAVVYILTSNKIPLLRFSEPFPSIIAVWVIIFTYIPLRNKVRDAIKLLMKRETYDLNEVSLSFGKSLLTAQTIHEILEATKQVIEKTLYPRGAEIRLFPAPQPLQIAVNTDDGGAFIPLSSSAGALGVITLQKKYSDRLYDRNDIKLLDTISSQAALAIEVILGKENLQKEKERINREIHDGIGSNLTKAILISENISNNRNPEHNVLGMKELKKTLNESLNDIRELIWTIDNKENTLEDVISYIFEKIQYLKNQENTDFTLHYDINNNNIIILPALKLNIVRIIQEAITNILKHSQASKISLSVTEQNRMLTITIKDNGIGFDTNKISLGYGLKNMYRRVEESKGIITISSHPQQGTQTEVIIPL
jgi:signal transduction histidine kinase